MHIIFPQVNFLWAVIFMCVYKYILTYLHTYIHTHTHIYTQMPKLNSIIFIRKFLLCWVYFKTTTKNIRMIRFFFFFSSRLRKYGHVLDLLRLHSAILVWGKKSYGFGKSVIQGAGHTWLSCKLKRMFLD